MFTLLAAVCEFKINGGKIPIGVSLQRIVLYILLSSDWTNVVLCSKYVGTYVKIGVIKLLDSVYAL